MVVTCEYKITVFKITQNEVIICILNVKSTFLINKLRLRLRENIYTNCARTPRVKDLYTTIELKNFE